jgi:hypothetical protein
MSLLPSPESPDCWQLTGVDDDGTPPTVSSVLNTVGTRTEWRRAGFPVLFDASGEVRHVMRGGRVYRFERVDEEDASRRPHCPPRTS